MRIKREFASSVVAITFAMSIGMPAQAQETFSLMVVAGHPPVNTGVGQIRDFFIPEVDRRLAEDGRYAIDWTEAYAGSVADTGGVLEAVESGIADFGYVPHLFEADNLPMEQVTYMAPFGPSDPELLMEIVGELHDRIPAMPAAWEEHNQKILAPVGIDSYHLVLTDPIESLDDLDGRRLGLAGLSANWMRGTDVVPVSLALPEYYNAMQTGLVEGVVTFESIIAGYNFHEVAPYIATANFGAMYSSALTVNLDAWDRLPEDVQTIMAEVADEYRDRVGETYRTSGEESMATAVEEGATIIDIAAEDRQAYARRLPNIGQEWAEDLDDQGLPGSEILSTYMEILRENEVDIARDWDAED